MGGRLCVSAQWNLGVLGGGIMSILRGVLCGIWVEDVVYRCTCLSHSPRFFCLACHCPSQSAPTASRLPHTPHPTPHTPHPTPLLRRAQHSYHLSAQRQESPHYGELSCRDYREAVLAALPHR
jgi:hypothetical protein